MAGRRLGRLAGTAFAVYPDCDTRRRISLDAGGGSLDHPKLPGVSSERNYLLWKGHDPDNADGVTTTVIHTIDMLADRWGGIPNHREALDDARRAVEESENEAHADTWDAADQTYLVDFTETALSPTHDAATDSSLTT